MELLKREGTFERISVWSEFQCDLESEERIVNVIQFALGKKIECHWNILSRKIIWSGFYIHCKNYTWIDNF